MPQTTWLPLPCLAIACSLLPGCTVVGGARVSAGPYADTDGHVGAEFALGLSWGIADERGTPMHDNHVLLETARMGASAMAGQSTIQVSAGIDYVRAPLRLGLGIGLRAPMDSGQQDGADQDRGLGDAVSLEVTAARLWNLDDSDRRVIDAGMEFHCGYRFLADIASCTAGPWIGIYKYKRVHFPH